MSLEHKYFKWLHYYYYDNIEVTAEMFCLFFVNLKVRRSKFQTFKKYIFKSISDCGQHGQPDGRCKRDFDIWTDEALLAARGAGAEFRQQQNEEWADQPKCWTTRYFGKEYLEPAA